MSVRAPEIRVRPSDAPRAARFGWAAEALAVSSVGVLLVALAYAGGRTGAGWAAAAYWVGQVLVFMPVVTRLLVRRSPGAAESFTLVMGLAVNQYLLKWVYSPDQLRFPDELQHWAGTNLVVQTGTLFGHNAALPVANNFPGLEEAGAALVSLTGIPVTAAGLLVAGVAHLVFVGALFLLARGFGARNRQAALCCVLYATGMHYLFFDAMYIYQTIALPFLALAVWAARAWRRGEPGGFAFGVIGVLAVAVVTVSHHVTALVLVGTLALLAVVELIWARSASRRGTLILAGSAVVAVGAWLAFPARAVWSYLSTPLHTALSGALRFLTGGESSQSSGAPAPAGPRWELAVVALSLLALLIILVRALWTAWKARVPDPWQWTLLAGGLLFFGSMGARFFGVSGPELAGRAATFTYLPMSAIIAQALAGRLAGRWSQRWSGRWSQRWSGRLTGRLVLGTGLAALLMVAARAGGWPPVWERLPGPYLVAGFERSVDAQGVAAAQWSRRALGTGHRVAADMGGAALVSSYGGQDPVGDAAQLYYDAQWGLADEQRVSHLAIEYLWVDIRLSEQTPMSGAYFTADPLGGRHGAPVALSALTKFDQLVGVGRVYDGGNIRIYRMSDH